MKNSILGFLLFTATIAANAQVCERTGTLVKTDVNLSGNVLLKFEGDSLVIQLLNFSTESGPDLDVYLSNEPNPVATGIKIDALKSFTGDQEYLVSSSVGIDDYKYVVVHCTQYNHLFGYALLNDKTGDCEGSVSTSEQNGVEQVKIFSSQNQVIIRNASSFQTNIYDLTGQLIHQSVKQKQIAVNRRGWILVDVVVGAKSVVKKIYLN